jgi:hypothetical protein
MRFLRRHDRTGLAGLPVSGDERLGELANRADGSNSPGVRSPQPLPVEDIPERLTPSYTPEQILTMLREAGMSEERPDGGGPRSLSLCSMPVNRA